MISVNRKGAGSQRKSPSALVYWMLALLLFFFFFFFYCAGPQLTEQTKKIRAIASLQRFSHPLRLSLWPQKQKQLCVFHSSPRTKMIKLRLKRGGWETLPRPPLFSPYLHSFPTLSFSSATSFLSSLSCSSRSSTDATSYQFISDFYEFQVTIVQFTWAPPAVTRSCFSFGSQAAAVSSSVFRSRICTVTRTLLSSSTASLAT